MNLSALRPICTWLRNEGFQLRGFALAIARKKDTRGIGAARGGREGSVGNPELQRTPKGTLRTHLQGIAIANRTRPKPLQNPRPRRELTVFAISPRLAAGGTPAAPDGDPRLAPGGKSRHLHREGTAGHSPRSPGAHAPHRTVAALASASASSSSSTATGLTLLLSPAAPGLRLPALCKALEIPINCCY